MKVLLKNVLYCKNKDMTRIEYIPVDNELISENEFCIGYQTFTCFANGNLRNEFDMKNLLSSNCEVDFIERKDWKNPLNIRKIVSCIKLNNGKNISLVQSK